MTKLFISLYLNLAACAVFLSFFYDQDLKGIPQFQALGMLTFVIFWSARGALLNQKVKSYNEYFDKQAVMLAVFALARVYYLFF